MRKQLRLNTLPNIRRSLEGLIRDFHAAKNPDPQRFRATMYGIRTLIMLDQHQLNVDEVAELQERIAALEERDARAAQASVTGRAMRR